MGKRLQRISRRAFYLPFLKKDWEGYYLRDERGKQLFNGSHLEIGNRGCSMPILLYSQIGHIWCPADILYLGNGEAPRQEGRNICCKAWGKVLPGSIIRKFAKIVVTIAMEMTESHRQEKFNRDIPLPTIYDIILCSTLCWWNNKFRKIYHYEGIALLVWQFKNISNHLL